MRTFKVECNESNWTGYCVLKHISYDAKWDYLESWGDISKLEGVAQMKAIRSLIKSVESNFIEVSLSHSDGVSFCKSVEDIKECPELHNFLMVVAMRIFNGNVGNG